MEKDECVKKLKELFQDYCFEIGKVPRYISALLPNENDIIICYKFISCGPLVRESSYNMTTTIEEVTGQPLDAPYGANDTLNVSNYQLSDEEVDDSLRHQGPVNIIDARKIINTCVIKLHPTCPVWVLTKSRDGQLLLSSFKKDGFVKRCVAFLHNPNNVYTVNDYLQIHKSKSSHCNSPVMAYFTSSKVLIKKKSVYKNANYVKITLTLSWTELKISPPMNDIKATVEINCTVGHGCSPLMAIWKQILLLHDYLEIIKKHKQESLLRVDLPKNDQIWDSLEWQSATKNVDFNKRIREIVQEPGSMYKINLEDKTNIIKVVESLSAPWRRGRGLLDNIWTLFIGCSSTQELFDLFKQLFIEVDAIGRMGNRFYHGMSSISRLAQVLEGIGVSTINLNPLEDLVELGIDKLRKEVISIFSYLEITTTGTLNIPTVPKFSQIQRDEWLSTAETWLTWLGRIYTVLEILSNLQEVPMFKKETLIHIVSVLLSDLTGPKSTIESLESLINNPERSVKLPLRTSELKEDILNSYTYDEWCLTLSSKYKECSEVTSVFLRSVNCIYPTSVVEDIDNTVEVADISICSKVPKFHCIKLHVFSDKLF